LIVLAFLDPETFWGVYGHSPRYFVVFSGSLRGKLASSGYIGWSPTPRIWRGEAEQPRIAANSLIRESSPLRRLLRLLDETNFPRKVCSRSVRYKPLGARAAILEKIRKQSAATPVRHGGCCEESDIERLLFIDGQFSGCGSTPYSSWESR